MRLGEAARPAGLDPAQPQQGPEGVVAEPGPPGLAGEALAQQLDLALAALRLQGHEQVGLAEVALVLGDLVLQDQVAAEGVPGQLGDQPVVLVPVLEPVGEDQVGVDLGLEPLEALLHGRAVGEEAVPEPLDGDPGLAGPLGNAAALSVASSARCPSRSAPASPPTGPGARPPAGGWCRRSRSRCRRRGPRWPGPAAAASGRGPGSGRARAHRCQMAQAGRPDSCSDSSCCWSLRVSIGAQKPS